MSGRDWLDDLYGAFARDPIFERAMKLGRRYRKSELLYQLDCELRK